MASLLSNNFIWSVNNKDKISYIIGDGSGKGNIDYKCLRSIKDGTFTFVEEWESVEALSDHLASPHFKLFSKESADLAEGMGIKVLGAEEVNLYE